MFLKFCFFWIGMIYLFRISFLLNISKNNITDRYIKPLQCPWHLWKTFWLWPLIKLTKDTSGTLLKKKTSFQFQKQHYLMELQKHNSITKKIDSKTGHRVTVFNSTSPLEHHHHRSNIQLGGDCQTFHQRQPNRPSFRDCFRTRPQMMNSRLIPEWG